MTTIDEIITTIRQIIRGPGSNMEKLQKIWRYLESIEGKDA